MQLVAFRCPSCGAQLNVDVDAKQASCVYCGATFPIDDGGTHVHQHVQYENAAQAGYEFEMGRQRALREAGSQNATYQPPAPQEKKTSIVVWFLAWLFVFPVPLMYLLMTKPRLKRLNLALRIAIIVLAWALYLSIATRGRSDNEPSYVDTGVSVTQTSNAATRLDYEPSDAAEAPDAGTSEGASPSGAPENAITLIAGQPNEYSQVRTMNGGTEFEETTLVYYVPAGKYQVTNIGNYLVQVNVYEGVVVTEYGWEEPANSAGKALVLEKGETGEITVPEGYYVDIIEPDKVQLVPID